MVTVIIPIYNTGTYLEECIKSVVCQTYEDLEIILINDGSTDESGEICRKWKERDFRIKYIEKKNEGQGTSRNLGITLATGDYIIFVDSDDYLDKELTAKVYDTISRQKADICVYSNYSVGDCQERAILDYKILQGSSIEENRGLLGNMIPILCNKMFSSKLIKNAGVTMSNRMCEDLVFNARLYVKAQKICMLDEPLYYYRYNRNGNMTTKYSRYFEVEQSIEELNQIFLREGLFSSNWPGLYQLSFTIFKDILFRIKKRKDLEVPWEIKSQYPVFRRIFMNCLERWFSSYVEIGLQNKNYLLIGSYNLRMLIRALMLDEDFLWEDYSSVSIISLMSNSEEKAIPLDGCVFKNTYRKRCVEQDVRKDFLKKNQWDRTDYIVMDLLEEAADLIKIKEGYYITDSEFFQEAYRNNKGIRSWKNANISEKGEGLFRPDSYDRISFLSKERRSLFIQSVRCFAKKISGMGIPVILVKNFLCERHSIYYDTFTAYENIECIREINQELEWCYQQMKNNLLDVVVVDASGFEELVFTHDDFPFGCQPEYYNNGYYQRMAIRIGECVSGNNKKKQRKEERKKEPDKGK